MRSTLKGVDVATSVRENNAEVPEALVSIAAKATQMDPNERYATVGDMEQAIVAYLEGSREESRRQELAEQKAQEARKLLEGEGGQETLAESRMKALSAVGRALALDSANADARELFITLLTERNRYVPAAAKEGLQAMRRRAYNIAVYAGAQGYASVAACFLLYALCIEDPRSWLAWGAASLWAACAGLTLLVSKHLKGYERLPYLLLVLANGAILVSSLVAGAVQLVPMFVLANVTNVILGAPPERRKPAAFLAMMTLLGPLLAEGVGLLPEPLTKSSNPISALTSMGIGPHLLSLVFSLTIHGVVLMTTMSFVGTLRRHLSDLEARMYLQSWQLRRLFGPELKNED
jgi:hypothetical protein